MRVPNVIASLDAEWVNGQHAEVSLPATDNRLLKAPAASQTPSTRAPKPRQHIPLWLGVGDHLPYGPQRTESFPGGTSNQAVQANRINSPWRDWACSSGPICRPVKGGWHGLAG